MRPYLLLGGALALGFASAGSAKPGMGQGNGHAFAYGAGHGNAHAFAYGMGRANGRRSGYGVGGCPPGLAKKSVACTPPGQAKKLALGSRVPTSYNLLGYNSLSRTVRARHSLSRGSRYVYSGGTLYEVSPRTRTVIRVFR